MSRPIVVTICMDSSSESWEPRPLPQPWQSRAGLEIQFVALGGPTMSARIGMMRARNRHSAKATPAPRRKPAKAYRVVR